MKKYIIFSPLKIAEYCEKLYRTFRTQYSLTTLLEPLRVQKRTVSIGNLILDEFKRKRITVCKTDIGICDASLQLRSREDSDLDIMNVDSLKWYLQTNESIPLYIVCEQSAKDYSASCDFDMFKFKELKMMIQFWGILSKKKIMDDSIKLFSQNTNEMLTKENETTFVWEYYPEIRSIYMHAERFKKNMDTLLQFCVHEIFYIMKSKDISKEFIIF